MTISNTDALARIIDHREIFHDEMLAMMRRIMGGEMSPVMIAAFAMGLRVKKYGIDPERFKSAADAATIEAKKGSPGG